MAKIKTMVKPSEQEHTAQQYLKRLKALSSSAIAKFHDHLASDEDDPILGVRMGQVLRWQKNL